MRFITLSIKFDIPLCKEDSSFHIDVTHPPTIIQCNINKHVADEEMARAIIPLYYI